MKIEINGQVNDVPSDYVGKLSEDLWALLEKLYETEIPDAMKTGLSALTRAVLVKEELTIRAQYGKEAARAMRPPPKSDPNLWLFRMFLPHLREILSHATLSCEIESNTITAFSLSIPSESLPGGQVDTDRDQWVWQDHSTQVS